MQFNLDNVPSWLKDDQGRSILRTLNDWGYYHPSELIVGGFVGALFVVGIIVIWRLSKMTVAHQRHHWNDDELFEKSLGLSAEELAEVGLPLASKIDGIVSQQLMAVEQTVPDLPSLPPDTVQEPVFPQSIVDLTLEQCLLIARFSAWRQDSQAVREAIKRVMAEGSLPQQKIALQLLEYSIQNNP
ncbi:MAG: hypothetical protein B7Z60_04905 [Ferrovum sp. 37-45-19]|jgi:hypothetical protein|uniref:hypothetical protein n=1 Tax=Ferrovum sp. JA12 TaxID=1356299 RepID=UPI0007028518|nr:hypothetical protein [Ferrovum sp. JA12]OYV80247.1 MAG: hypothetical protein B7Z65_02680 [Ferrovum sp. 21-44-67]OYV94524.1 MAG: hypothetical protein B7Z60_04905 [Ferrovum sp. 37-45-19]OZB33858.1 MAG: hypothetical protein B7X47_02510 [Ferrovum sp. 34-44-207]HQT81576.1 hypothetical protein [Ferrovaceae bacterium]KRH78929.1 hypothetical protein FERRO_19270 [Ferrovum sp. JA12]